MEIGTMILISYMAIGFVMFIGSTVLAETDFIENIAVGIFWLPLLILNVAMKI